MISLEVTYVLWKCRLAQHLKYCSCKFEKTGKHHYMYVFCDIYAYIGQRTSTADIIQGPVVGRPISANLGLNFNPGFFFFCSKAFSRIIFSLLFRASHHQLQAKRIQLNLILKLSYNMKSNFWVDLTLLWTTRPWTIQSSKGAVYFYSHHYQHPGTVNSRYTGHCRDLELVSLLARVRNSGSPFQSNVCKMFSPRI